MKLQHIFTIAFLFTASTLFSQTFSVGPRIGGTLTNFGGLKNASYKTGLTFGAFLVYSKREHSGLGIEVLYSGEGSLHENTITNGNTVENYEYNTTLHYIKIPINATHFFNTAEDKMRPKVSLGPSIGFLMDTKQELIKKSTFNGNTGVEVIKSRSMDNYNRLDIGVVLGAGVNYKIQSRTWLNLDLRYNYGLLNVLKNAAYGTDRINNQGASLSVGLAWGINKN